MQIMVQNLKVTSTPNTSSRCVCMCVRVCVSVCVCVRSCMRVSVRVCDNVREGGMMRFVMLTMLLILQHINKNRRNCDSVMRTRAGRTEMYGGKTEMRGGNNADTYEGLQEDAQTANKSHEQNVSGQWIYSGSDSDKPLTFSVSMG